MVLFMSHYLIQIVYHILVGGWGWTGVFPLWLVFLVLQKKWECGYWMFKEDSERWFGKFAFKTCYFSRRKGAKSWNGMWRPTSVWFSLIGSMVTHGCTWFAPSKSPKSRESHAMYFSQIERPFSFHFFWCFYQLVFEILNVRWSYSQDSDQICLFSGKELQIPSGWNLLDLLKQGLSGRDQPRNDWNMETWKAHGLSKNGIFHVSTWWTWKRQLDFRLRPPYFANFFKTNFVEPLWVIWWSSLARDG